jgi:hypothetical protein
VWSDIALLAGEGEFDYFFADPSPEPKNIPQKNGYPVKTIEYLEKAAQLIHEVPGDAFGDAERIKAALLPYADQEGRGNVLWPFRYSLSGRAKSPDPFVISSIIGKDATSRRIATAVDSLKRTTQ